MTISAIDLEIIRHRLETINADAGETLVRVSGSQIASEAGDYNTALMAADGAVVACSKSVVVQSMSLHLIVADILTRYSDNPGIRDGDQFLTNDPYIGALHQPDVTLVAPIFVDGELIAWSGCTVHSADVGGPVGGGFNQAARSIFDEPLPIAPIRLVEQGRIRADIERDILARSRTPALNALDLLGQVAANQTSAARVGELVARYGAPTVTAAIGRLLDTTERAFRARIAALPDGRWRDVAFLQHERLVDENYLPNQVYAVRLTLTKAGDRVTLDFSDSDAQAPGAVNSAYPALANFAMAAVLVRLCHGMPWVPGAIWRAIDLRSQPGTIVHAEWPAGVAMSTGTSAQAIRNVTSACIGRMLDASAAAAGQAMASSQSTGAGGMSISGLDAEGRPFHTLFLDELTGGGGATGARDGTDVSGTETSPGATPSNVETNEAAFPVLYLTRSEFIDSAGPGQQRGGVGTLWSYRPHKAGGAIALSSMAQGLQHPATLGILGGEPGTASGIAVAAGEVIDWADVIAAAGGQDLPLPGAGMAVRAGQSMIASSQGGGGLGDPIDRDPADVLADIVDGLVSRVAALRDYGVAIDGDHVDAAATATERYERRRVRLDGRAPRPRTRVRAGRRLSTHFDLDQGRVVCAGCSAEICDAGGPIMAALPCTEHSAGVRFALTALYPGSERFRLRRFHCPGCGTQVDVQIALAGDPPFETIEVLPVEGE
jgi:N-methylhydantoinase B